MSVEKTKFDLAHKFLTPKIIVFKFGIHNSLFSGRIRGIMRQNFANYAQQC